MACSDERVDFWGNELTLHKTEMKLPNERHDVDMGKVPVPHFGVHLDPSVFNKIKENIKKNNIQYLDEPHRCVRPQGSGRYRPHSASTAALARTPARVWN